MRQQKLNLRLKYKTCTLNFVSIKYLINLVGPNLNFKIDGMTIRNVTKNETDPFLLECSVQGYPTPEIKLVLFEKTINGTQMEYDDFENKIIYEISSINRANNGTYSCLYNISEEVVVEMIHVFVFCM